VSNRAAGNCTYPSRCRRPFTSPVKREHQDCQLPDQEVLRVLARAGLFQRAGHAERAADPGVGRQGREPSGQRPVRHRREPIRRGPRARPIDADMRVSWFTLETLTATISRASRPRRRRSGLPRRPSRLRSPLRRRHQQHQTGRLQHAYARDAGHHQPPLTGSCTTPTGSSPTAAPTPSPPCLQGSDAP